MLSMLRLLTKMTGKEESELRILMKNELDEMEQEVAAMKKMLEVSSVVAVVEKSKGKVSSGGGRKKAQAQQPSLAAPENANAHENEAQPLAAPENAQENEAQSPSAVSENEAQSPSAAPENEAQSPSAAPEEKDVVQKKKPAKEVKEKTPKEPKAPKEVKEKTPKEPKAPKEVNQKPPKEPKAPKEVKDKTPKEPKEPKAPKEVKEKTPKETEPLNEELVVEKELERGPTVEDLVEEEVVEEEEEVEVEEIEYDGVKYFRSSTGIIYDIETSEEIGRWNEATKGIEVE